MKIGQLTRKRHVLYRTELSDETPGAPVHTGSEYEAFKLQIRRRDTDDRCGEVNFLIRERSNRLRYLILYCFMDQPGEIHMMSFWVNSKVELPSGEVAFAGKLMDDEKAAYCAMDFCESYLKKNYTFVSKNLQQL